MDVPAKKLITSAGGPHGAWMREGCEAPLGKDRVAVSRLRFLLRTTSFPTREEPLAPVLPRAFNFLNS